MTVAANTTQAWDDAVLPASGSKTLVHLQALRGIAASLVVLSHTADTLTQYGLMSPLLASRLGISGYFGVATFFIISGFIIYRTSSSTGHHAIQPAAGAARPYSS